MNVEHKWSPKGAMSEAELGKLGGGDVAYIKEMTSEEAIKLYPGVKDLPTGVNLFALHHADGTPIALTDSRNAALGHAIEDELIVHSVH
jgi:hypothetical protein